MIVSYKYIQPFLLASATIWGNHRVASQTSNASYNIADLIDGVSGVAYNGTSRAGYAVSSGGDFDGDGIDDLIISTGLNQDQVYVVFGNSAMSPSLALENLDGTNGFAFEVNDSDQAAIASGCDLNHDGIDDLIIGAPKALDNAGQVYVLFGSNTTMWQPSLNVSALNGVNGYAIDGFIEEDQVGFSVACAGDVNGDGIDDFAFAATGYDDADAPRKSRVYVVWGSDDLGSSPFNLANLDGTSGFAIWNDMQDTFGNQYVVSSGGDVNDDGFSDIVLGDEILGEVYVLFGSNIAWTSPFSVSQLNGTNGFICTLDDVPLIPFLDQMSLASDGDVNGDNISDIVIGIPYARSYRGDVIVVFGTSGTWLPTLPVSSLNGTNGFVILGVADGDDAGTSVATGGDLNGDNVNDLLIGARRADAFGKVYVVYGSPIGSTWASNFSLSQLDGDNGFVLNGINDWDNAGWSVSSGGDVNGDGGIDIVIGAPLADPNGFSSGQVYVIYGVAPPSPTQGPTTTPLPSSLPTTAASMTPDPTTRAPTSITDSPAPTDHLVCLLLNCCESECCGNGTSWSPVRGCFRNSSSTGWDGKPPEEPGCGERICCEGDCCGRGTTYNSTAASCEPTIFQRK